MNRILQLAVGVFAAVLAASIHATALGAADEKPAEKDLVRQVNTMAKVLETRLREELGADLVGPSLFQPGGVRGFAVPGVGAIFQLNVNFPVVEPQPPAEKPPKAEEEDLWARMERGEPAGTRVIQSVRHARTAPAPPAAPPRGGPREAQPDKAAAERRGEVFVHRTGPIPPADAAKKLDTLERVILETLAKYGERMTALGDDDNIIVLVGGGNPTGGLYVTHFSPGPLPPLEPQPAEPVQESIKRIEGELRELQKKIAEMTKDKKGRDAGRAVADQQKRIAELQAELAKAHAKRAATLAYSYRFDGTPHGGMFSGMLAFGGGAAGGSSWVFRVKKNDLAKDPDELRKKSHIQKYAGSPAGGGEAGVIEDTVIVKDAEP